MYLDLLKHNIQENYNRGYEAVFDGVSAWLQSRGFKEDDFSDPVFIDKHKLDILTQSDPDDYVTIHKNEYHALLHHSEVLEALEEDMEIVNKTSHINDKDSINQKELFTLRADSAILDALMAAGVDNWEGHSHAMEILNGN